MALPSSVIELSHAARLESVRLLKSSCEILADASPAQIAEFDVAIENGAGTSPEAPLMLIARVGIQLNLRTKGESKSRGNLRAEYGLLYRMRDQASYDQISGDLAAAFAAFVAPTHLWPHAREFFMNMSWRMALPNPIMLPPLQPETFPDMYRQAAEFAERHETKTKGLQ